MPETARILVIEDDADARRLIEIFLRDVPGYDVTYCASPIDALPLLGRHGWDLLITDFRMPGMDGLEVASRARRHQPHLPVLLTTANASADTAIRAVKQQVTDFLSKPLDGDEVRSSVANALAQHRRRKRRVLAIGAHPDDVEIGAGATLAQHVTAGDRVTILTVSPGHLGGDPDRRRGEAEAAAALLGARLVFGDLPDTAIPEGGPTIRLIESVLEDTRPHIVYVHSHHDVHQDHRSVHAATLVAARHVPRILCYQSPSSTLEFRPSLFVPATSGLPVKLDAIAEFSSQTETRDYLAPDLLTATARYWGRYGQSCFAEPFELVRATPQTVRHVAV
ncbi:MAG: response regulator [Desertimonas sp.]